MPTPDALRLRRADRRAECRQIDAAEFAGRRQGLDRHAQSADDAVPVRGIAMAGQAQIIFVDTPGIFAPKRRLDRAMVGSAWQGATDADLVALLIDAQRARRREPRRIRSPSSRKCAQPRFLVS
jgi:hypothetical protein